MAFHERYAERIADGLAAMVEVESIVQSEGGAADCLHPTKQNVANFSFALVAEVCELAAELGWKPWKPATEVKKGLTRMEHADVVAFFSLVTNYVLRSTGLSPRQLADAFLEKSQVNIDRLSGRVEGYGYSPPRPGTPSFQGRPVDGQSGPGLADTPAPSGSLPIERPSDPGPKNR